MKLFKAVLAVVVAATAMVSTGSPAAAAPGSVVINEIHYNPVTDLDDHEFLELHNPGDTAVDLTGYTIGPLGDPAITLTAPLTGTLAPGAFAILGPDGADTLGVWGVTPIATYTGKLSNGGEEIQLLDANDTMVGIVEYSDDLPWPTTPDGDGPSLELIDPDSDNSVAASWAASIDNPTPGAVNSVFTNPPATPITNITITPTQPAPGQTVTVSADIAGGVNPDLVYVIEFGAEVTVPMTNIGGATFSATIPGQAAGELVRYRIDAPGAGTQAPTADDGRRYLGYVVDDPAVVTNASLFEWFIPEADYDSMFDDPFADVTVSGSVMAINGVVYDNIEASIRGGSYARRNLDKQGLSIDLPDGITMNDPALVPYAIDEFALSSQLGVGFAAAVLSSWTIMEEAGFPVVHAQDVRVERNGEFYGIYRFSEKLDGTWRSENNIDGEFWKAVIPGFDNPIAGFEQKQPDAEDLQPIIDLNALLSQPASDAKTEAMYQIMDIPNAVNWMAAIYAIGHVDSSRQNFYLERNTDGRWKTYPWDLTNTFGVANRNCDGSQVDLTCVENPLWDSLREIPEVEDMIWRRLRTIIDGPMADGVLEGNYANYYPLISVQEQQLDDAAWEAGRVWRTPEQIDNWRYDARRSAILADSNLPASQSAAPGIVINEIHYNPADGGVEFVELYNPTSEAIDLTGWELDGIGLDFPGGTVILPGAYVIATEDIEDFTDLYTGIDNTVLVEFDGGLSNGGETLQLIDADANLIDEVAYDDEAGWPTAPDGNGPSLELIDPTTNNNIPASWLPSTATGGSPGAINNPAAIVLDQATVLPVGCQLYDSSTDGPLNGGETRTIETMAPIPANQAATSGCDIPTDASAVTVTITATNPTAEGNLRLVPSGGIINGGVVNYAPNGLNNSNTVTVPVASDGTLELSANGGVPGAGLPSAGVTITLLAYYHPNGDLQYHPLTPCTARDTRLSEGAANPGPFTNNATFDIDVKGALPAGNGGQSDCGVPDTADAVLVNIVALNPTGTGHIDVNGTTTTAFAPLGMNNAATSVVDQAGLSDFELTLDIDSGSANFRIVVLGYYDNTGTGSDFIAVDPCVGFDSRTNQTPSGSFAGLRDGGETTTYTLTGTIPASQGGGGNDCDVPADATGVLINVVALNATTEGNLQVFETGTTPTGGVLNFADLDPAMNNANAIPVSLSDNGTIDVFVNTGPTNIADATNIRGVILGYYTNN